MSAQFTEPVPTPQIGIANGNDLVPIINNVRAVMFDIDGCLVISDEPSGLGGTALPGARACIEFLDDHGIPFVCFTNGSMQTPDTIARTLQSLGLPVRASQVMTPAVVAARTIATRFPGQRVLVFGEKGTIEPFVELNVETVPMEEIEHHKVEDVPAVVVGWDTNFNRQKAVAATEAIFAGAELFTTSMAPTFAWKHRINVGISGFITAGLQHLTGAEYTLVGKPSALAFDAIARFTGAQAENILIIGDDLRMEAGMAVAHGAIGGLVTTGTNNLKEAQDLPFEKRPHFVIDSLESLAQALHVMRG